MSWRIVVISNRAKLDLQLGYLVVRGETVQKIHLSEISLLMIESTAVSLTAALLAELTKLKIKVIFCDEKRNPSSELIPYYGAHDSSNKVRTQISWKDEVKGNVWREMVRNKILNQAKVLELTGHSEADMLKGYAAELRSNDESNREGHAAKVYFNALFGMGFSRADDNIINAALNYGYSILLSACNREITANGYITQLGIHHSNIFNAFNLGSDMMEAFRPFVDNKVLELSNLCMLEGFEKNQKMAVVEVLNKDVLIGPKVYSLNYAVKLYIKNIFRALNDEDVSLISPCFFKE
ncbi:type II CRISPR-associated endonuclease Cas1 [Anaerovibrio sp.]|uniref:type II CRISPR-associated endonuclease Cas1 n=1 Tax=Anaerovibrio sp. TaxID=1872532 RepID=UPI00388EB98E